MNSLKEKSLSSSSSFKTDTKFNLRPSNVGEGAPKSWRDELQQMDLKAENFNYEIIVLVESSPKCFPIVDAFCRESELIEQSRIRCITQIDIEKVIHNEYPFKGSLQSMSKKLSTKAKAQINSSNTISKETEAAAIKLILLWIRDQYLCHKNNYYALKKALENEQNELLTADIKDSPKKKKENKKNKKEKKEKKGKKGKKDKSEKTLSCDEINKFEYPESVKIRKKMESLKQSEEFNEPTGEVDLYFLLATIYNYELLSELQSYGVQLLSLLDFAADHKFATDIYHKTPFETSSDSQVRAINVSNFWRACGVTHVDQLIELPKNMCYLRYYSPIMQPDFPEDAMIIYNDLLRICYNLTDFKRLHTTYLKHMVVFDVEALSILKLRQFKTYNMILNKIPNEFITVPVIVDAMMEEVMSRLPECLPIEGN